MQKSAFVGSIYSAYDKCDCGGAYQRLPHAQYGILVPFCVECGMQAHKLVLRRNGATRNAMVISHNKKGEGIYGIDAVIALSEQITREIKAGAFNQSLYKRKHPPGSIGEPLGEFIERVAVKKLAPSPDDEDHEILMDYMSGYFADTGVFAANEIHLDGFLKTFHLKFRGEVKERVKTLFWQVKSLAQPNYAA